MTPDQIKLIHVAAGKVGLNRQGYQMILVNVAGVKSCKDLTNLQFENCMAVLEDMGFGGEGAHYWADKVTSRTAGGGAIERLIWKVKEQYAFYEDYRGDNDPHYELAGLIARATKDRTRDPDQLKPREAWNLIEQLKKMIERLGLKSEADATLPTNEIPF